MSFRSSAVRFLSFVNFEIPRKTQCADSMIKLKSNGRMCFGIQVILLFAPEGKTQRKYRRHLNIAPSTTRRFYAYNVSRTANSRTKNVGVFAIVVAKLKRRNLQRHILAAHLVKPADNASLICFRQYKSGSGCCYTAEATQRSFAPCGSWRGPPRRNDRPDRLRSPKVLPSDWPMRAAKARDFAGIGPNWVGIPAHRGANRLASRL